LATVNILGKEHARRPTTVIYYNHIARTQDRWKAPHVLVGQALILPINAKHPIESATPKSYL